MHNQLKHFAEILGSTPRLEGFEPAALFIIKFNEDGGFSSGFIFPENWTIEQVMAARQAIANDIVKWAENGRADEEFSTNLLKPSN